MNQHLTLGALCFCAMTVQAQHRIATNQLQINPKANVVIPYAYDGEGTSLPVEWGFDTAWRNEQNFRKGINHMDGQKVDIVRVSFTPWEPLVNDTALTAQMKEEIDERIKVTNYAGKKVPVEINDDHATVHEWYKGKPERWVALIKATAQYYAAKGHPVVSIAPFNEPDFSETGQGTIDDMKEICRLLKADPYFEGIRICGGNTLNCDQASIWYNYMKEYLDEGNTHQLAGEFDAYANFFQEVRTDDKHATADELHNIMEAFVGAEYGMQTGIWWGSAERARGELMQSMSNGVRLGYGESRPTWMAGTVYRKADGKVKAFIGQSERQAKTTTFAFRSDRPVFYDGQGPMREMYVSVKGGTGYLQGTTGGERVYDVHTGEDIPPVIDGRYYIVNRGSGHYFLAAPNTNAGTQLATAAYSGKAAQQWEVHPLPDTRGGDYSYHSLVHVASGKAPDVENWSLSNSARIMLWEATNGGNQVYYLEYDSDGYFRLVNQESNLCLQASKTGTGAPIIQGTRANSKLQQWRFIPVGIKPEYTAPAAPTGLTLTRQSASLRLDWDEVQGDTSLVGYNLYRSVEAESGYQLIARGLTTTSFVDHDILEGHTYYYKVKATDSSLNTSADSEVVNGSMEDAPALIAAWSLNQTDSLYDTSENHNHMVTQVKPTFSNGIIDRCLYFNGNTQAAQLPYDIATRQALTFTAWVKWGGGDNWQRVFDFGNDTQHYMFLSPSNGTDMVFGIKNGGEEERLTCKKLPINKWAHVAVTIGTEGVTIYVDGQVAASSATIAIRPADIAPGFNYLGRSQFDNDPLLKGYIDDVRLYNYALTQTEVEAIASMTDGIDTPEASTGDSATAYDLSGRRAAQRRHQVVIQRGAKRIQ